MVWRIELCFCMVWYVLYTICMTLRICNIHDSVIYVDFLNINFKNNFVNNKSYFLNGKLILKNTLNEPRLRTAEVCYGMVWHGRLNKDSMAWDGIFIVPHLLLHGTEPQQSQLKVIPFSHLKRAQRILAERIVAGFNKSLLPDNVSCFIIDLTIVDLYCSFKIFDNNESVPDNSCKSDFISSLIVLGKHCQSPTRFMRYVIIPVQE